jgi:NADH-quinone oxidoreductase subunit N
VPILIPSISFGAIAPELILTSFGCVILLIDVFSDRKGTNYLAYLSFAGVMIALAFAAAPMAETFSTFAGMYSADKFTQFFKIIFLVGTGLTVLISVGYVEDNKINHGEYYALILFATVGMMFMAGAGDMMTVFLGLELLSICLYVLAGYTRTRQESNEASLKYFLLGAFATGFLLYGMALIYGVTGETNLSKIASAVSGGTGNMMILTVASALVLVGLAFKIGAVPFHQWTPDVYQGAPIPITAFMSAGPKAAGLAALLRVFVEAFSFSQSDWTVWVSLLAILTMTLGNIAALVQKDFKRMLAFSSIGHAGYALVGVAAGNGDGMSAVMYYLLVYTFMNIGAFGIFILVARKNERDTTIDAFKGFGYTNPMLAAAMTIFLFSLAGIPPMAGFLAKFYIFMSAVEAGKVGLVLVAVINSAIGVFYYLKVVVAIYMKEPASGEELPPVRAVPALVFATAVSVYGIIALGVAPGKYIEMAGKAFLAF